MGQNMATWRSKVITVSPLYSSRYMTHIQHLLCYLLALLRTLIEHQSSSGLAYILLSYLALILS